MTENKTRAACLLLVFVLAFSLFGCTGVGVDTEEEYYAYFRPSYQCYTENTEFTKLSTVEVSMKTYLDDTDNEFHVPSVSGYLANKYRYIIIAPSKSCKLTEMCLYVYWDKESSGANASSKLSLQYFVVKKDDYSSSFDDSKLIDTDLLKKSLVATGKGVTDDRSLLIKEGTDATINLTAGKWGSGKLIKFSSPLEMDKGSFIVIKFLENNDATVTFDGNDGEEDDFEKYEVAVNTDNDVAIMIDKLRFYVSE